MAAQYTLTKTKAEGLGLRISKFGLRACCPGSAAYEAEMPEIQTEAAQDGTACHQAMDGQVVDLNDEQEAMVDHCHRFRAEKLRDRAYQTEVPVQIEVSGMTIPGTVDTLTLKGPVAIVIDWKFGRAELEESFTRYQMAGYALGVMQTFNVKVVDAWVYAPRLEQVWHAVYDNQHELEGRIQNVIAQVRARNVVLSAGSHCTYCRAQPVCFAFRSWARDVGQELQTLHTDLRQLAPARLERLVAFLDIFRPWSNTAWKQIKDLPAETLGTIGREIRERQGRRYFPDAVEAYGAVRHLVNNQALLEKLNIPYSTLKDLFFAAYIKKNPGAKKKDAEAEYHRLTKNIVKRGKPSRVLAKKEA